MDYQALYKEWAADRYNIRLDRIKDVSFGTTMAGYCETCEYPTFEVTVYLPSGFEEYTENASDVIQSLVAFSQRRPS